MDKNCFEMKMKQRTAVAILFMVLIGMFPAICAGNVVTEGKIMTLKDRMDEIQTRHGVSFVYDSSLELGMPCVGGGIDGLDLRQSLEKTFLDTGIDWKIRRRHVVLNLAQAKEVSLDIAGETVEERRDTIAESRITSDKYRRQNSVQTGMTRIDSVKFNPGFAFLSSPDVIKTLQQLPGVASGSELMSGLYVHGGTGYDNLFLLDGVPLYQVSHLVGLFSSFNTDVVESLDFYKSGFPACYGGRLSSVVDVKTKDGDFDSYHGIFSIGLIDGRIQYEGPIVKDRTSFNVSMRRSWLDIVTTPAMAIVNATREDKSYKTNLWYSFWDINGKVSHKFSEDNKLVFNVYSGADMFKLKTRYSYDEDSGNAEGKTYGDDVADILTDWGNFTASLTWNNRVDDRFRYGMTAYYTHYRGKFGFLTGSENEDADGVNVEEKVEENNLSRISDIGVRADFDWSPAERHLLRFGTTYQYHLYNPYRENIQTITLAGGSGTPFKRTDYCRYDGHEAAVYAEDEMSLAPWLGASLGLRYVIFGVKGKAYHSVEPRAALRFSMGKAVTAKVSYTEMSQFSHQISTMYMDLPSNGWMPSTSKVSPMYSRQIAGGVYMALPHNVRLNIEGYYKTMDNLREYYGPDTMFPPLDDWENSFKKGKGRAYGAEVEAGWKTGRLDLAVYYTLSWSKRKFDDFYYDWYLDRNDNRHKFTVNFSYRFSGKFDMYAAWNYHTGNRFTAPTYMIDYETAIGSGDRFLNEEPYNVSLPDYHRLDIGFNFRKKTKRGNEGIWNLSIYNAYCRTNPIGGSVSIENGRFYGFATGIIPIIPSFSYTLKF